MGTGRDENSTLFGRIEADKLWKERYANRTLTLAEDEGGYVWILVQDLRAFAPRWPSDDLLARAHHGRLGRADDTRRIFIEGETAFQRLSSGGDTEALKLADWLARVVLRKTRKLRPEHQWQPPRLSPAADRERDAADGPQWRDWWRINRWPIAQGRYGLRKTLLAGIAVPVVCALALSGLASWGSRDDRVLDLTVWLATAVAAWLVLWMAAWLIGSARAGARRVVEGLAAWRAGLGVLVNCAAAATLGWIALSSAGLFAQVWWHQVVHRLPPARIELKVRPGKPLELHVNGPIGRGSARALRRELKLNPGAGRVVLHSPGGLVIEGLAMGRAVADARVDTAVRDVCASSCTLVFVAGQDRLVGGRARVGFHRSSSPVASQLAMTSDTDRRMAQWYLARGVDQAFVHQALQVPPHDLWAPGSDVLRAAGVATAMLAD